MSTEPVIPEVIEQPKVFRARREIPVKSADGTVIGQPQVYEAEGATQAEADQKVIDKMAESIAQASRRIKEFNLLRKNGGIEAPKIPEGADVEEYRDFTPKPRKLSEAELLQISIDLKDPARQQEAFDRLYEARVGLKPEDDARLKQQTSQKNLVESATAAAIAFSKDNPEFHSTSDNKKAMLDYMVSRDAVLRKEGKSFPWTKKNLEIAYRELKADGLLAEAPVREEPKPVAPRTEARVGEVTVEEPVARKQPSFPSAIRPSTSSGGEQKVKPKGPTAKELAMMSPAKLREYMEANGLWGK